MDGIGKEFIARARYHLADDFLPKIERAVELLTDEQIWWRPNDQSNSIGNLILHLSGNARQWIVCGLGGANDARDRDSEFAARASVPRDELFSILKQTVAEVDSTLARFHPDHLLQTRSIQGLEVSALEAILHVVEHFSMHTGQIIMITKMLTKADLAFYEFIDSKPVLKWKRETSV
jgi:uncharacterized damage-inducible protein DinB